MKPWENPIPPVLFKYLHPSRLASLADCRIRFSQRSVFEDTHELQPDVVAFGTLEEIWRFIISKGLKLRPGLPTSLLVRLIAETPSAQARASRTALENMKSIDEFGVFCLTEAMDSEQMWTEYADKGKGFVIAFDTTHLGFTQLSSPGKFGKVAYSDEPYGTYLGMLENEGVSFFFRKRMTFAFEREWRSIRALHRLERRPGDVYVSSFDPASVTGIIIRSGCVVETQLRDIIASDARYQHVQLANLDEGATQPLLPS